MNETILPPGPQAKKISLKDTFHFDRNGFSGDVFVGTEQGSGYNALLVDVHGKHYRTGIQWATRNYFVVDGEGKFTLDGVAHQVQKGDLYVIPDGHDYEYEGNMKLFEFNINNFSHEDICLEIYDLNGGLIKKIKTGNNAGYIYWDGTDISGNPADKGLYIYILRVGNSPKGIYKGTIGIVR